MMSIDPITAAMSLGKAAIERIWPDPTKRAEELRKLEELRQGGNLAELQAHVKIMLAQVEVNKVEASHPNVFISGWRPFVGWVCGFSLAWSGIAHPLLMWVWSFAEISGTPPPMIESGAMVTILLGMLGIGGMRSHDKRHGVDTKKHG